MYSRTEIRFSPDRLIFAVFLVLECLIYNFSYKWDTPKLDFRQKQQKCTKSNKMTPEGAHQKYTETVQPRDFLKNYV